MPRSNRFSRSSGAASDSAWDMLCNALELTQACTRSSHDCGEASATLTPSSSVEDLGCHVQSTPLLSEDFGLPSSSVFAAGRGFNQISVLSEAAVAFPMADEHTLYAQCSRTGASTGPLLANLGAFGLSTAAPGATLGASGLSTAAPGTAVSAPSGFWARPRHQPPARISGELVSSLEQPGTFPHASSSPTALSVEESDVALPSALILQRRASDSLLQEQPVRIQFCPDEPDYLDQDDASPAAREHVARHVPKWSAMCPLLVSDETCLGCVMKNTFMHLAPPPASATQRRSRSVPRDMGSSKDMWHATRYAFNFATTSREEGVGEEQHIFGSKMSVQSDDDKPTWADQTFSSLDTSLEDEDEPDDDVFDSSAASDTGTWLPLGSEAADLGDDEPRQSSSYHNWWQGNDKAAWNNQWSEPHAKQTSWGGHGWWERRHTWDSSSSSGHRSAASGSGRRYNVKKGRDAWSCRKSWWTSERWEK